MTMNVDEIFKKRVKDLGDWRGERLLELQKLITNADPDIVEEWKWDTLVFSHNGMVVALGSFADHIKINFFKGAKLSDPHKLFNAGLEAKTSRAIDLYKEDKINTSALEDLIREAVSFNKK